MQHCNTPPSWAFNISASYILMIECLLPPDLCDHTCVCICWMNTQLLSIPVGWRYIRPHLFDLYFGLYFVWFVFVEYPAWSCSVFLLAGAISVHTCLFVFWFVFCLICICWIPSLELLSIPVGWRYIRPHLLPQCSHQSSPRTLVAWQALIFLSTFRQTMFDFQVFFWRFDSSTSSFGCSKLDIWII